MLIHLYCTDKDKVVEASLLNHKPNQYLEVALNTVKINLKYHNGLYKGSMAGLEFTVNEKDVPVEYKYNYKGRRK